MTTLSAGKLALILAQAEIKYSGKANLEVAQAIWKAAQAEQREEDAKFQAIARMDNK